MLAALSLLSLAVALPGSSPLPRALPQSRSCMESAAAKLPSGDALATAHASWLRSIRPSEEGPRALLPSSRWSAVFDERGVTVRPSGDSWEWGLEFAGVGRDGSTSLPADPAEVCVSGTRLERRWSDAILEWYDNGSDGLEHGFDLDARPCAAAAEAGPLELRLRVRGALSPIVDASLRDVSFADPTGSAPLAYRHLEVFDAAGRELPAWFELRGEELTLRIDDREATYPVHVDPIAQSAYLKPSNTNANARFGEVLAISGDTAVVGSPGERGRSTGVNGDPLQFGSVNSGAAYVFVRTASGWHQEAYLKASNAEAGDRFGTSVAIDGDVIVVGAPGEDSASPRINGAQSNNQRDEAGAAYVFRRSGGVWSQEAYLKPSVTGRLDHFGERVAVSGSTVIVSSPDEDSASAAAGPLDDTKLDSGAVYVFASNQGTWFQQAYLKAASPESLDTFGASISLDGPRLLIGAPSRISSQPGSAYLFSRSLGIWSQAAELRASNADPGDGFGVSTALLGTTLVVGASGESGGGTGVGADPSDNSALHAGAAYVFELTGSGWQQTAYLKASNTGVLDHFGGSVALGAESILVGSADEDGSGTGVNPADDDAAPNSGAAYLYVRGPNGWTPMSMLKASNADAGDRFGASVALSDTLAVVGAPGEASATRQVNGAEDDNRAPLAGAGYAFDLPPFLFGTTQARHGTPRNPVVYRRSSRPVIGQDFRSSVDHTTFLPGATLDLLFVTPAPPVNIPSARGTILVDLTAAGRWVFGGPGTPFSLRIPDDCALVGLTLRAQAGSMAPGSGIQVTNALDLLIGSF